MNGGVTFIILGGTGDLARKKLYPSLMELVKGKGIDKYHIIATSRRDWDTKKYVSYLEEKSDFGDGWDEFSKNICFSQLDFYDTKSYESLKEELKEHYDHRIFYLATLPQHFKRITDELGKHDLVGEKSKVMYEKPFGEDLESAKSLNEDVLNVFPEDKVYRVDHYLGKELVDNISVLRFTNAITEPLWCSKYIDHVQIVGSENMGVEGRGEFYDSQGVLKDFFQSHLMQLLALTSMEEPGKFNSKEIRDKKVDVLKSAKSVDCITGQYKGYHDAEGVKKGSKTETFAALKMEIDNDRWRGTPFYLMSGKNLKEKKTFVYIRFKNTQCKLFDGVCPLRPNELIISVHPKERIYFRINTKVPGDMETVTSEMDFSYTTQHGSTPTAYANLFYAAIQERHHYFVRSDEIEEEWRIIDEVEKPEPFVYEKGHLPEEAIEFMRKDDKSWHL